MADTTASKYRDALLASSPNINQDNKALLSAVMAAESQGQRYDDKGRLLTSPAGAQGEMQVLRKTQKDPGFGVAPAKDKSPDEIARVGRDYLMAMLDKYEGNKQDALVAYNWGPRNADKWISGGRRGKLPKETQDYVKRVDRMLGGKLGMPAPVPAKTLKKSESTLEPMQGPRTAARGSPMTREEMEGLGSSYQAALAAATLGGFEDEGDGEETIAERYMADSRRRELAAADEKTFSQSKLDLDLMAQSPFEEEAPVQMAAKAVKYVGKTAKEMLEEARNKLPKGSPEAQEKVAREIAQREADEAARRPRVPKANEVGNTALEQLKALLAETPVQKAHGGVVHRQEGSPIYGEIAIGDGGVTKETLANLAKGPKASAAGMLRQVGKIGMAGLSNAESVARGMGAAFASTPGEFENIFVSDKERKNPTLDEIRKSRMPKRLTTPTKEADIFEEIGTYIDPTELIGAGVGAKSAKTMMKAVKDNAPAAAKAVKKGAEEVAPYVEEALMKLAPGAEPMYIMTPKGRVALSAKSAEDEPLSRMDLALKETVSAMTNGFKNKTGASEFMDKKVRAYLKNNIGTVDDEIREGLLTGRIKPLKGSSIEALIPESMVTAARNGDMSAMRYIEEAIRKESNIRSMVTGQGFQMSNHLADLARADTRQAILGQLKDNPDLIPDSMLLRLTGKSAATLSPEKSAAKVAEIEKMLSSLASKDGTAISSGEAADRLTELRSKLLPLLEKNIYDMSPQDQAAKAAEIRDKLKKNPTLFNTIYEQKINRLIPDDYSLVTGVPSEQLVNAGGNSSLFALANANKKREGIMALEQNAPITDVGETFSKIVNILGYSLDELGQAASRVSDKELSRMSVADLVNKAAMMETAKQGIAPMVAQAGKLVSAGKPVPADITTYGTKVVVPADKQGFVWREITDPYATEIQGKLLANSIGGYSKQPTYGWLSKGPSALVNGEVRLFSLFDPNNQVVSNVEFLTQKAKHRLPDKDITPNSISQFFGNGPATGNVEPYSYLPQVESIVNFLKPDEVPATIKLMLKK